MKVLTAAQMREVDRRTIESGISGEILMENAAHRVVEFMARAFAPLADHRIVVLCGTGNNGGDGLAIARVLHVLVHPRSLHVVLSAKSDQPNYKALLAAGGSAGFEITPDMRRATLVVDALLGTGLNGPARGRSLELIREINTGFPDARAVAVDVPSGMQSDTPRAQGETARADATVTFTAPKICHALAPSCDQVGELYVAPIGSPASLYAGATLSLSEPCDFEHLFRPRPKESNKGIYGHALVIAGGRGKTGAAAMAGLAALRAGAGLVTIASAASAISDIGSHAAELMTEPLPESSDGSISSAAFEGDVLANTLKRKTVVAVGPGLGTHPETVAFVRRLVKETELPMVIDADALNALADSGIPTPAPRILTPHPGEMSRLTGLAIAAVQADRLVIAREFAEKHKLWLILKGNRSLIASPGGEVWINPTGSPAMATGGTGDILTGMIAGLLAQFPEDIVTVLQAAVWLHGRAGELAAAKLGEKSMIAGDLLTFLPEAIHECSRLPHAV